jgi:hypothetical protein
MHPGASEPLLAPHAGVHGGATPRAGWRGWPRPRVRGAQPRQGAGMIQTVAETNALRLSHRNTSPRCLLSHRSAGRCPSRSPRGHRAGSPDPSAAPLGPPQAGEMMWSAVHPAAAHASAAIGGCAQQRTGGWPRMAGRCAHMLWLSRICVRSAGHLRYQRAIAGYVSGLTPTTAPALRRTACAPARPNRSWSQHAGGTGARSPAQP